MGGTQTDQVVLEFCWAGGDLGEGGVHFGPGRGLLGSRGGRLCLRLAHDFTVK